MLFLKDIPALIYLAINIFQQYKQFTVVRLGLVKKVFQCT